MSRPRLVREPAEPPQEARLLAPAERRYPTIPAGVWHPVLGWMFGGAQLWMPTTGDQPVLVSRSEVELRKVPRRAGRPS